MRCRSSSVASTGSCTQRALLGTLGPIEHQSFDSWLSLLRVNVAAPMGLTRALLPQLGASPDASVIFTLDNRGEQPRAYWGGYAVTKAGVATLAREIGGRVGEPAAPAHQCRRSRADSLAVARPHHPGEDRSALPLPDALVPLYLHLLSGQGKADSGKLFDAQTWLAGTPCATALRA
jgi:hypothetical protein